jgi:acyl carrier protein
MNSTTEISAWLLEWFARNGTLRAPLPERDLPLNYFEARWIDSMGVIELITDVEAHFDIGFDQRHFQDRRFATVAGLAEIIDELRNGRRG